MDVIGLGNCCIDLIMEIDRLPGTNQFVPLHASSWQGGGKVATAMAALGRLGAACGMLSVVGGDAYGRFLLRDFEANGVDTTYMITLAEAASNFCLCLAERETGGRSYVGSLKNTGAPLPADLPRSYFAGAKYLHLSAVDPAALTAAGWMREQGGRVSLDADRYVPALEEHLDIVDIFIGSEYFFEGMFPGAKLEGFEDYLPHLEEIRRRGPSTAVVTLGERGSVGLDDAGFFHQPAFPVPVRDTTGAGDVFHGAFLYGLLQGWSSKECARFASAASAVKCTVIGGRAGIPTAPAVERFLETGAIDPAEAEPWLQFYGSDIFSPRGRDVAP